MTAEATVGPADMHHFDDETGAFATEAFAFALRRARSDIEGVPLGHPRTPAELDAAASGLRITEDGLGPNEVLRVFAEVLEPACLSVDFPRYFAFIPAAPTETSILADMVVSACSIYAGSWLEGGGAVWAENQALRWLSDLAGLPPSAGGCFVSGGTMGNLSALVAARHAAAARRAGGTGARPDRWVVVTGPSSHASVRTCAQVMDAELVVVGGERLTGAALRPVLAEVGDRTCAVVATAGSTNLGLVDDLASVADACVEAGVWLHVDGAYGLAALAAPSVRHRFAGIERVDSLIVDPHKWLFAPFDACAVLYRDPSVAKAAHCQHGAYLDVLTESGDWNPSDYAVHLSRRARGLPFWFSLAANGTRAYADAVEHCLTTARAAAELVRLAPHLELVVEPELSVVVFRRRGWAEDAYVAWSRRLLESGLAFVVPSTHAGETVLRLCIVNPRTTVADVEAVLATLA
ncbi:MAG: hypothetical protein QOG82_1994 [Actinomycetota bacterium]|nr:hypothetical protein [Actinomycetota bacterium]